MAPEFDCNRIHTGTTISPTVIDGRWKAPPQRHLRSLAAGTTVAPAPAAAAERARKQGGHCRGDLTAARKRMQATKPFAARLS